MIEFATTVAGPLSAQLLADEGASVIKIEPREGDLLRRLGSSKGGMSGYFANFNRGKRSIVIDLRDPAGVTIVKRMVADADVFVQNLRHGVTDRLGVGYEDLRAVNPDLIYVSISGCGPTGPYAGRPFYDPLGQALSGLAGIQQDGDGTPHLVRTIVADKVTGLHVAQAVSTALVARLMGRGGQHVEVPLLDATVAWLFPDVMMHLTLTDADAEHHPNLTLGYDCIPAADGFISAVATTDAQFKGVWRALGKPEMAEDPKWSSASARSMVWKEAFEAYAGEMAKIPRDELVRRLVAEDVPAAPVLSPEEVLEDPQVVHSGLIEHVQHPHVGGMRQPRLPMSFSGTPVERARPAPALGEQTDEILAEFGYDAGEVAALRAAGTVA